MSKELLEFDSDPYSLFIFAINSPSTKEEEGDESYNTLLSKFVEKIQASEECLVIYQRKNCRQSSKDLFREYEKLTAL
jgi:hypothetical protein